MARLSTPGAAFVVLGMGGTHVRDEELARALYAEHAGALLASDRLSAACIGPKEDRFLAALERVTPELARAA